MSETRGTSASTEDWQVLRRHLALVADPWMRVWREDLRLPEGREVDGFLHIEMRDHVVIVVVTEDGRVVIERGYKHGPRKVCLSLPAGYIEPGEDPTEAARRELREETGFVAEHWEPLGAFTNDGNCTSGHGHFFLARGARRVSEPDSGDLETVTIELMTFDDLLAAVRSGDVAVVGNAAAIVLALLRLQQAF